MIKSHLVEMDIDVRLHWVLDYHLWKKCYSNRLHQKWDTMLKTFFKRVRLPNEFLYHRLDYNFKNMMDLDPPIVKTAAFIMKFRMPPRSKILMTMRYILKLSTAIQAIEERREKWSNPTIIPHVVMVTVLRDARTMKKM